MWEAAVQRVRVRGWMLSFGGATVIYRSTGKGAIKNIKGQISATCSFFFLSLQAIIDILSTVLEYSIGRVQANYSFTLFIYSTRKIPTENRSEQWLINGRPSVC